MPKVTNLPGPGPAAALLGAAAVGGAVDQMQAAPCAVVAFVLALFLKEIPLRTGVPAPEDEPDPATVGIPHL